MVVTWEEALAEREERGQATGREEGLLQAKHDAILTLARHRFRALPVGFEDTVLSLTDLSRLDALFEQVVKAETIRDVAWNRPN